MKRILLATSVLVPLGFAVANGCAVDDTVPGQTTGGVATGGDNSSGASGNNSNGTSGTDNTTGASGSSQTTGMGGSNSAGGDMMGNTGGTMMNAGGMAGTMGTGGMGGSGNAGDSCATASYDAQKCIDEVAGGKSNFGFSWKDSWFITGCAQKAGHDCITIATCPNGNLPDAQFEDKGSVVNEVFPLGGTMDADYLVSFKFNGVAEGKFMTGGSWAVPATDLATMGGPKVATVDEAGIANNTFYIGGTAVPSNYNVMRIRVLDSTKKEIGRYYMNAYDSSSGAESHRTFLMSYAHTIPVKGGGSIEYHIADSNCHAIDNCGAGAVSDTSCDGARNIPNENNVTLPSMYTDVSKQATTPAATPAPVLVSLASLNPITQAKQPWHSQISHFTITKIVAK
jgi:hypothetical protein